MTAVEMPAAPPGSPTSGRARRPLPAAPDAQRLDRPSWRDGRLLAGVLLLLASVVVGARVLSSGTRTTQVLTAAADLTAGHVLTDADLTTSGVRLDGGTGAYLQAKARSDVMGKALTRGVSRGELVPASAVADAAAPTSSEVSLAVRDGRHPGLSAGDRVDVFATTEAAGAVGAAGGVCTTVLIASGLEVVTDVPTNAEGSAATVILRVAPGAAQQLVHAGEAAQIDLVRDPRSLAVATGTAAPTTGAAPGQPGPATTPTQPAPGVLASLGSVPSGACATGK